MATFEYSDSQFPIRDDIKLAYREYWQTLASPGSWWSGEQRIAIAREVRNAGTCKYCIQRKPALSPYNFEGEHDRSTSLPAQAVDAIHRIITDQTRITRNWIEKNDSQGLSKECYVELAGITVNVFSIDEFNRALGLELEPLPEAQPGEPSHYRPKHLSEDIGFVPTIPLEGAVEAEADLWSDRTANVLRAFTLVPDALRDWIKISNAQYLSIEAMGSMFKQEGRSIDRMQIELVAGRVSAINQCFY
jgi:hypothetical protein